MTTKSDRAARRAQRRGRRSDRFLRQGASRAVLVANGYRPVGNNPVTLGPAFFASWLTTEGAPALLATWVVRTAAQLRVRHRDGRPLGVADQLGLGLTVGAAIGAIGLIRQGQRSEEEYEAALSPLIPAAELDERPAAVRLGALLPLLNGNRRRRRTRNVRFTDRLPDHPVNGLSLDVYAPLHEPEPGERRPAVLQIHGGAWVLGSKNEQGIPLLNHLASCGWVGFNVDYRLSPRSKFPDHLVDCKLALTWIREHADEYGVDPDFIAVTGGSAGGHLCALMALTQNDPAFQPGFEDADTSVQAAVPFYGVYDLTDREDDYGNPLFVEMLTRLVMGEGPEHAPESWAAYSPLDRVNEDAPPMFVIHGDKDVLVPVSGARRFVELLRRRSRQPVVYAELHGAQHAFEVFPSFRTVRTVEYVERFLHHVHARHLAASDDHDKIEPVPDDAHVEPKHADEVHVVEDVSAAEPGTAPVLD